MTSDPGGGPPVSTMAYAHIAFDADGEPILAGAGLKVRAVALEWIAHGREAEEIRRHHPDLTLGQIHSALAYYFDHREEMDRRIEASYRRVHEIRDAAGETPGRRKLRELGLRP